MKPWIRSLILPVVVAGVAALLGAGITARSAVWEWSKTAATNSTADPTINWSEGMAPSAVNDSARAMMARLAEYRDDISGVLATGGTSTAYTVTTNQGLDSPPVNGQMLAFTPHATNGTSATLAADGGTAYAIQTSPGNAVASDTLVSGTPYVVKFNLSATAWVLHGVYANPFNVPLGTVLDYVGATAPNSNFVLAYGQCISRTTYATFFALVSTTYGVCDGTSTFGVPDYRGRLIAGRDDMGGSAASRITNAGSGITGTTLGSAGGAQTVTLVTANLPAYTPSGTIGIGTFAGSLGTSYLGSFNGFNLDLQTASNGGSFRASTVNFTGSMSFTGDAQGGTSTAVNKMAPTIIANKIIRIF